MRGVVWELLGVWSVGAWRALRVLREAVLGRIRIRVLRLWRGLLMLLMLLMDDARGSRLLQMVRGRRPLLRVVGMVVIARHGDTRLLLVPSALSVCHFRGMLFSNRVRSARRRRREKTCPKADEPAAGKDTHSPSSRASMWRVECRMPQTLLLWSSGRLNQMIGSIRDLSAS
jgi:hypothetical protein